MKTPNDIILTAENIKDNQQPGYSKDQKLIVYGFIMSVASIYGHKGERIKEEIDILFNQYVKEILSFTPSEIDKRLDRVKKLFRYHDDYKWPYDALARACGPMDGLQHDYSQYYPTGDAAKSLESIKRIESKPADPEKAKQTMEGLKGLFK